MISLMSVCLPVSPHASARLPLNEFPRNLILETAMKIRREKNPNFVSIRQKKNQEVYMKTSVRFIVAGDIQDRR